MVMSEASRALPAHVSALPPGTRLAEFEIRDLLGVGGFGIVYRAFDHALEREVAIKEYMPASMAGRTETLHVSLRSQGDAEVFALGLKSFVSEAKLLAKFDHPSLIKVHRFWEANGTAYMAMPLLRGHSLKEVRQEANRSLGEAWVRDTLAALLGALEQLHREDVFHRDISPDNIHLDGEGRPVLLDFGAARRVIRGKTRALTTILKPAYAPVEQYGETETVKQGPWTDFYALGATMHYMLLGYPPAPATARMVSNEGTGLSLQAVPGHSSELLGLIEWMLAPRPADRPHEVAELRAVLQGRKPLPPQALRAPPSDPEAWLRAARSAPEVVTVPLGDARTADLTPDVRAHPQANDVLRAEPPPIRAAPNVPSLDIDTLPMAADDSHRLPPPPARSRWLPIVLVFLAAAGVAGYLGWSRLAPGGATAPPAAASAAVASPSAPASAPTTATEAPAEVVPPVTTPAPSAPSVAAAPATATAGAEGASATPATPAATRGAESGNVATAVPAVAARQPMLAASRPAPRATARAPASPPSAAAPPLEVCRGRSQASYDGCMERECSLPASRTAPECHVWRLQARPRDGASN